MVLRFYRCTASVVDLSIQSKALIFARDCCWVFLGPVTVYAAWWLVQALGLWVVACFLLDDAEALGTQRLLAASAVVAAIGASRA